ncbi:sensor histidine kinase, partial [Rubrivirga sp.]|uniref:sensor histidine kinase n=1 Tax=Rubrivirga sp. TaxID=1885344 RepID=UPI003C768B82
MPRIGRKGLAVIALVWIAYTLAYAVAVSIFARIPLAIALDSQILTSLICAALSAPVWLVVVRGLDGRVGRQIWAHAASLPVYAVGSTALLGAIYAARGADGGVEAVRDQFGWIAVGSAMLYIAQFAAYHALAASQRATRERRALDEARALAREQELRSLRAQLNPHFLFNALNAISAEVGQDPGEAREMIGRLSGLLRYSLASGRRDLVPLADEVAFVRDYLALESARMGDRLVATVEVDDRALEVEVPPMSVQTLVENAVRHGIAPLREGGQVTVTAAVEGNT